MASLLSSVMTLGLTSCEDQPNKYEITGGVPSISYIRMQDVAYRDSLIDAASLQDGITIVGENLTSITEMWFNDIQAVLNTSYITKNTLLVTVPKTIPGEVTDKIYMHTKSGKVVEYPFHVTVPGPIAATISNEYAKAGDLVSLSGQYFVDDPNDPLTITFTGINNSTNIQVPADDIKSISQGIVTFILPDKVEQGQLAVHTIYGDCASKFYMYDKRGIITDFDGPGNASSVNGIVPQGWNLKPTYSDEGGCDGSYCQITGVLKAKDDGSADDGWNEDLKLSFWAGNWNGDPMSITSGPGAPLRNVFPEGYFADPSSLSFKFELCIPASNPWQAATMQVLFINNQQCANDSWQNNTYIHTSGNGGPDLCRGFYRPWVDSGSFDTDGQWITVTMPLSEFTFNMDGTKGAKALSEDSFDSFTIWPVAGGVPGVPCEPIFRYDNFRIVPNL